MADNGEKIFMIEFIEKYRSLPALWNVKEKIYSDRAVKEQQYEMLLEKYKERYPHADKKELSKKLNCLRTSYRRELKRIRDLEKSGAGVEDSLESSLYFFDALNFLSDVETPSSSKSTFQEDEETKQKKTNFSSTRTDELIDLATERLKRPKKDPCEQIGSVWGQKLSEIDGNQRLFAEKLINDVLFNGQLGLLNYNTALVNLNNLNLSHASTPYSRSNSATFVSDSSLESPIFEYVARPRVIRQPAATYIRQPVASPVLLQTSPPPSVPIASNQQEYVEYVDAVENAASPNITTYYSSFDENI